MWYLAYGSNVNPERLRLYLEGGVTEPGARDSTAPVRSAWRQLPFRLTFGLESQRWSGGGVAFVFPDRSGQAWFRAWDLTAEQFEDVFAQENRLAVGTPLPWEELLAAPDQLDVGGRWYGRVFRVDDIGLDAPAFTFSATEAMPANPPHEDYRGTIAAGLADHPLLADDAIEAYLDASSLA